MLLQRGMRPNWNMTKLLVFQSRRISQNFLRNIVEVQSALAQLKAIDRVNKGKLRALILAGAESEAGVHFVDIRVLKSGRHRLIVR